MPCLQFAGTHFGRLEDDVVEIVVGPVAIEHAFGEQFCPRRAGQRREDRHLDHVDGQVVEHLQGPPKYGRVIAIEPEDDPRLHADAVSMQQSYGLPILLDAVACLVHRFQVVFGERLQTHKNADASGVGHKPHHLRIICDRQRRLRDPTFAQRYERRKQPLGVLAISRQVVINENEHTTGQLLDFGDHFFDRPLALCTLAEGGYRAEIAAVRASSCGLDSVDRAVLVVLQ